MYKANERCKERKIITIKKKTTVSELMIFMANHSQDTNILKGKIYTLI